jgi:hypothetical protein
MKPLWLYRPLLNIRPIFEFAHQQGIKKMMPPEQLHGTLATVRAPVEWDDLELETDELVVPEGHKMIQIFGYTVKAMAFGHPRFKARHEYLLERFPTMDHPMLRPHVTLYRGGKMPREGYTGELVFGPEIACEFSEQAARNIKHISVKDWLENNDERS